MLFAASQQSTTQAQVTNTSNTINNGQDAAISWLVPVVIAAFIAAISNLVITGIKFILEIKKSERDARRIYEYEARKRLYREFEPLSFQLIELAEIAIRRIRGFAREASQGYMDSEENWYSDLDSLHMMNAIYRLMTPLAIFRLMQRRLTHIDIELDKSVKLRYSVAKILYYSFTHDMRLAESDPSLDYKPRSECSEFKEYDQQEIFKEQGIYHQSSIDTMADALIAKDTDNTLRIISFSEFRVKYVKDPLHKPFDTMGLLFKNFHPKTRPVLWRILLLQLQIYQTLINIHNDKRREYWPSSPIEIFQIIMVEREDIDWRRLSDKKDLFDKDVWVNHLLAIEKYLQLNWADLLRK